jgi:acyl dehydratase
MPISYPQILELATEPRLLRWSERDTLLYALGVGLGHDALDAAELPFVYEKGLRALPTQATAIAWGAGPSVEQMGFDLALSVHAQERLEMHRPLPASGELLGHGRVTQVLDRGPGKGALLSWQLYLADPATREPVATLTTTCLARGDGGFGGTADGAEPPHQVPARQADLTVEVATRPEQALIYRLSGDMNPLHVDPKFARQVGFERPILHGLCTYAIACHAVLKHFAGSDPARLRSHLVRFSAPVLPGDVLAIHCWRDSAPEGTVISFEISVPARDAVVIKGGRTVLV